jgi:hypothetical protein
MSVLQVVAVLAIGVFLGVVLMSVLSISRTDESEGMSEVLQAYGLSLIAADDGGWFCTSGNPARLVGDSCTTPLEAVMSAIREIKRG